MLKYGIIGTPLGVLFSEVSELLVWDGSQSCPIYNSLPVGYFLGSDHIKWLVHKVGLQIELGANLYPLYQNYNRSLIRVEKLFRI